MAKIRALDGEVEFRVDHRPNLAILEKRERRRRHCRDHDPRKDGIILFVLSLGSYPRSKEQRTRYDIASVSYREAKSQSRTRDAFFRRAIGTEKDRKREKNENAADSEGERKTNGHGTERKD